MCQIQLTVTSQVIVIWQVKEVLVVPATVINCAAGNQRMLLDFT